MIAALRPGGSIQTSASERVRCRFWITLRTCQVTAHARASRSTAGSLLRLPTNLSRFAQIVGLNNRLPDVAYRFTRRTRDQAKADVFDYIECFYNPKRWHSTLGYLVRGIRKSRPD
jgi:hypothetical protein